MDENEIKEVKTYPKRMLIIVAVISLLIGIALGASSGSSEVTVKTEVVKVASETVNIVPAVIKVDTIKVAPAKVVDLNADEIAPSLPAVPVIASGTK